MLACLTESFAVRPSGQRAHDEAFRFTRTPAIPQGREKNDDESATHALQHALVCSKRI
jgi:hypothetical protein